MSALVVVLCCLAMSLGLMSCLWAVSLALRDSSIVDIWWGAGFAVLAWTAMALVPVRSVGSWVAAGLVTVWGLRLTAHLASRNIGRGEDPRYTAMREKAGDTWPVRSLFVVFWLQGAIMWVVAMPVLVTVAGGRSLEPLVAAAGVFVFCVGLAFETIGDWQLTRFVNDPGNRGKVMDRGLWRYTRHPNYFGDATVWWGLWLIAAAAGAFWTFVGPALINFMLVRVSGKAMLESGMKKTRPGYESYVARTSGFIPRPPRRCDP